MIEWETLSQGAMSLYEQGNYDRCMVVAKKALKVPERKLGPEHPHVAMVIENMSEV